MKLRIAAASLLGSMAVLASVGMGSAAGQPGGGQLSQQDQNFMMQNAQTEQAEILAGQLAAKRATTPQVRQAAQTIMSDHEQELSRLRDVAQNTKVTLPYLPDATQQQEAQQLKAASYGSGFDQTYLQNEIKGHQTAVSQTQQQIQSGGDGQVVDFAKSYLPMVQQHLQMLQQLNGASTPSGTNPAPLQ